MAGLSRSPGSAAALPSGSQPGDVLFNGNGSKLAGTRVGSSMIDSFTVGHDGRLTAAPGSPFPARAWARWSELPLTNPDQLFVSNAHNTATDSGTVSAFRDSGNWVLSSIGSSPFADQQMAPCWVEITHNGQFLFTVNTASGTISRYSITPGGTLTLLGSTPVRASGGVGAVDERLSPGGRYLYVDESKIGAVGAFAVHGGNLTELAGVPDRTAHRRHTRRHRRHRLIHQRISEPGAARPRLRSSRRPRTPACAPAPPATPPRGRGRQLAAAPTPCLSVARVSQLEV